MNAPVTAESIANSVFWTATARVAAVANAGLLALVTWFGSEYVASFKEEQISIKAQVNQQGDDIVAIAQKTAILEENGKRGREDREEFQRQTTAQLQTLNENIRLLSNQVSALTATIAERDRRAP